MIGDHYGLPHDYRYDDASPKDTVAAKVPFGRAPAAVGDPKTTPAGRRQFASWLTSSDNPLFTHVAVNDLWAMAFGEGIIPKKDNWDLTTIEQAVLPQTLAVLVKLFQDFNYDSRSLMAVLVATDLYAQTATLPSSAWNGPRQKRLVC